MTTQPQKRRRNGPNSMGEKLSTWEALSTRAKPQLADNPLAAADQAAMDGVIAGIKAANAEQDALTAKLRDSVSGRQKMQKEGQRLHNRLISHLRSKLGPESELLREFGIKPQGSRPRKKPASGGQTPDSQPPGAAEARKP